MSRFFSEKYAALTPYTPGEQPQDQQYVKLNTNESPFPPAPGVAEAVRDAFRDLFQADNSDYAARQKRIENFVTEINGMLQETAPDKWKYHQVCEGPG